MLSFVVALGAPAVAAAENTALDAASTSRFVSASDRLLNASIKLRPQETASISALIHHIASSCPGAVPASLKTGTAAQQKTWQAFSGAGLLEIALAEVSPVKPEARRAIGEIAPLRWTSAAVNRQVAMFVRLGRDAPDLRPPDLCAQAAAAARSGFAKAPPAIETFLHRANAALPSTAPTLGEIVQGMKPLVGSQEGAAIAHLRSLQSQDNRIAGKIVLPALRQFADALFGESGGG